VPLQIFRANCLAILMTLSFASCFDIDGLIFTRDDRFLLTGSVDTTIKFWDMKTGHLSRTISITK